MNNYCSIRKQYFSHYSELDFITKSDLLADQKLNPPFGSNLSVENDKLRRIHRTSGTTNTPLFIAMTENDIKNTIAIGKKCFELAGLKKGDTVVHCLSYNMWMGGFTDHQSLEATGAAVIPFGVGNSKYLIETILDLKPNVIHCTPSYLAKLELILSQDFNIKPIELGLKLGLFGAESGLQYPDFRKRIEKIWGLKAMNANYGLADVLSMFGAECKYQCGLHFLGGGVIEPEIIDPETLQVLPLVKGTNGELVLTNLVREAQPLYRYRTGDLINILSIEQCQCGETSFRFEIIGRSDDMLTIKGVNVFLSAVDNVVHSLKDDFSGIYQIYVNRTPPYDTFSMILEVSNGNDPHVNGKEKYYSEIFYERLSVRPDVKLVNFGELPRTEGKTKKIFKEL